MAARKAGHATAARRSTWRPLLTGALRREALQAALDVARDLRAVDSPEELYPGVPRSGRPALRLLLNTGLPAQALLFGYLDEAGVLPEARPAARRLLETVSDELPRAALEPWLLKGFAGVAWLNHRLCEELFEGVGDGNDAVDAALLRLLRARHWDRGFDLLYGLVGIGVYALERLPRRAARGMLREIVRHLGALAERHPEGLAWLTRPGGIAFTDDGSYSLGMAHGAPAVVALLARVVRAGVARREARRLLEGAVPWLLAQRLPGDAESAFPPWTYPGHAPAASRAAWCYGDPGIALALLAAGRALERRAWIGEARSLMLRTSRRRSPAAGIRDATLCHGAAGLGHLLNRYYQATGEERVAGAARSWYREALRYRRPGRGIGGFEKYGRLHSAVDAPEPGRPEPWSSDPGLLTGAAGIALALLAAATPVAPAWDRLLLIDVPARRAARAGAR